MTDAADARRKKPGARPSPSERAGDPAHLPTRRATRRGPRPGRDGAVAPFTVFLDRDGVFNRNPRIAVVRRHGFRWLPGALDAFARLNRPGIQTCLATNQPVLGTFTLGRRLRQVNAAFRERIEQAGGRLDRIEASLAPPWAELLRPVLPERVKDSLRRRKPGPGMLEDGGHALAVDRARAVMVGDKVKDAEAAAGYGIPCILLATTHSEARLRKLADRRKVPVHAIVPGLGEAVDLILDMAGRP